MGAKVEAAFLRSIVQEKLTVVDLELVDYERMAELVEITLISHSVLPMRPSSRVAERLGLVEIATLVRRHFHAVRPRHVDGFELLP